MTRSDARWILSFLLYFAGAVLVGIEVFTALALMHLGRDLVEQLLGLGRFIGLAAATLGLAVLLSTMNRWRSLGRALLVGAAVGLVGALPVYIVLPDPYSLTWQLGLANLVLVVAVGAWLDRPRPEPA